MARSREAVDGIALQIAHARLSVLKSQALLARVANTFAPPVYGVLPSDSQASASEAETDGTERTFAAVTELIEQVENAAERDAGLAGRLIEDIILAIQVVAEPSLLMGILLEGMAETVLERLSEKERRETAIALCALLWERINQGAPE